MKKTKKGFTLVELVIVVAVMAVLVAVAIPTVGAITSSAKDSVAKSNAQTIESMIKLEEADRSEGSGSLNASAIASVIVKAKLGINTGVFEYDKTTGNCTVSTATVAAATSDANKYSIGFNSDNTVSVYGKEASDKVENKSLSDAS